MEATEAIDTARQAIALTLIVGAPVLVSALVVGLVVSVVQAATQVQEQTLTFVPKLVAVAVVCAIAGPWILSRLVEFAVRMFGSLE